MRNPFRRRPIRRARDARDLRCAVLEVKRAAINHVVLSRMLGIDDLMIIAQTREAADSAGAGRPPLEARGADAFAREVARLVHANPSEGIEL